MIELRDLKILSALARHRHFARAAQECNMSQPAFSMRIRNLEERLGLSLVRRGNRFQGLTAEGEMIVRRARRMLDEARALEQDISSARGEVTGILKLGVVPTATAFAAKVVNSLYLSHPRLLTQLEVTNSHTIQQQLYDGSLDAGITYADSIGRDMVELLPLYDESYMLLAPLHMVNDFDDTIAWAEIEHLPLSLLSPKMQNRRIVDHILEEQGLRPRVITEASGFMAALIMARGGTLATIVPRALIESLGVPEGTRALSLVDPETVKPICLATLQRNPELTSVRVLRATIDTLA